MECPFVLDCPGCVIDQNCCKSKQELCYKFVKKHLPLEVAGREAPGAGGSPERGFPEVPRQELAQLLLNLS